MKFFATLTATLSVLLTSTQASAQFAKAEDAIKYRKNALFVMGQHFGRLGAMATGRMPFDAKLAQENAEIAEVLGKLPWAAFTAGTDKGETRANAEIWTEPTKFKEASDRLASDLSKLNAAAKSGNFESVKTAFTAASASCKNCHDNFRGK
jgi:cytochrome c556